MSKQISDREIDRILFKLHDILTLKERGAVKELLQEARGGGLYQEELKKKLLRLRNEYKISEAGRKAVEETIFSAAE